MDNAGTVSGLIRLASRRTERAECSSIRRASGGCCGTYIYTCVVQDTINANQHAISQHKTLGQDVITETD